MLFIVLLLLPVSFYFLIKLPAVQTYVVRQVTDVLSEQMAPATVSVGAVHYAFFTRLMVDDIYVSDMQNDTLLYVKQLTASIASFSLSKKNLALQSVKVAGGVFHVYSYPLNAEDNTTNIADIVAKFRTDTLPVADRSSVPRWTVSTNHLEVTGFRFTFRNVGKPTADPHPKVIDFADMDIRDIAVDAHHLRMAGDTLCFELKGLRAVERSGYRIDHLTAARGQVCGTQTLLEEVELADNHSRLTMRYYKMDYENARSFNNYIENVRMEADFHDALFSFRSIGYLARDFHLNPDFRISGTVSGTVAHLRSNLVQLHSASVRTRMAVRFRMDGLPRINETTIYVDVQQLITDAEDLTGVLQGFVHSDTLNLAFIAPLTDIRLTGNYTGLYNDFAIRGLLNTNLGAARFDLSLAFEKGKKGIAIKGDAQPHRLHIGKLFNQLPQLGETSGMVTVEGNVYPTEEGGWQLKAGGRLLHLECMDYDYKNITVNGVINHRDFDGTVNINDPNLSLAFEGKMARPKENDTASLLQLGFDAVIHHANLAALHLVRDSVALLSAAIKADYSMQTPLDGLGDVFVSDIRYTGNNGLSHFGDMAIQSFREPSGYRTTLRSDMVDADYIATRPLSSFVNHFVDALVNKPLPVWRHEKEPLPTQPVHDDYTLEAVFKNTAQLAHFVLPGLHVSPHTGLYVKLSDDHLDLRLVGEEIAWNDYLFKQVELAVKNENRQVSAALGIHSASMEGLVIRNILTEAIAKDNSVAVDITYDNQSTVINRGTLAAVVNFMKASKGKVSADLHIAQSELVINDSTWAVAPAHILLNDKIQILNFHLYNHTQDIKIDGILSNVLTDTLLVEMENFDMANINFFTAREGFHFKGLLSGRARIVDVYNTLRFSANVTTNDLLINDHPLGRLTARSWWDNADRQFLLRAVLEKDTSRVFTVRGIYSPGRKYIDLTSHLHNFELVHITPFLNDVLTNITGTLSGEARAYGPLQQLTTEGKGLYASNVAATVDYLKTRYYFNTPVFLAADSLGFNHAELRDSVSSGTANLSVVLKHNRFKNLQYDVTAYSRNLQVLNTSRKDNEVFYGRAYATGAASIKGGSGHIAFDINLKAERNSQIHIRNSSSSQVAETGLLTFAQPAVDTIADNILRVDKKMPTNIDLALSINATPETEVILELDDNTSDAIHSFGSGDIKMQMNTAVNKFELFGDYLVDNGSYSFAIESFNLIQKQFHIEEGGRITFNGDLTKTNLNLSAVYRTVASLNTLLGDTSSINTRRPVDCRIGITGSLFSPTIALSINIQNIDALTQARVESLLDSDEKRARQFLALIAFGSFMPDEQLQTTDIGTGFLVGSATEILSGQLSRLIEQLKLPFAFNAGFSYMPSQQGRDDAFEVSFSTRIWDNRIVINGNVGSANSQTQNISNDFDADIRLGNTGKFHLRVFTRSVDHYTDNIDNTQRYGVGILFQEEFDAFSELYDRWFGQKKRTPTDASENE